MKKSKLDQHRDLIVAKLMAKRTISQVRRDLELMGCEVSRTQLTEWVQKLSKREGLQFPVLKPGRPAKAKPWKLSFLPPELADSGESVVPQFVFSLSPLGPLIRRAVRNDSLRELSLPPAATPVHEWDGVARFSGLSDAELCLIALLRGDLGTPPLDRETEEMAAWFRQLVVLACKLRDEIREASSSKTK